MSSINTFKFDMMHLALQAHNRLTGVFVLGEKIDTVSKTVMVRVAITFKASPSGNLLTSIADHRKPYPIVSGYGHTPELRQINYLVERYGYGQTVEVQNPFFFTLLSKKADA